MMHVCTEEWDRGAAVTCCGFPLRGGVYDALWEQLDRKLETSTLEEIIAAEGVGEPLFKRIREDGAARELPLVVATIRLFAEGRVRLENKRLVCDGAGPEGPYDLSAEVDEAVAR
jgi:phosphoribosylglycinamide formyltransferase-1